MPPAPTANAQSDIRAARWGSLAVVLIWSGSGVFANLATRTWSAIQTTWWESLCGLVFMSLLSLGSTGARRRTLRALANLTAGDALRITILGLLAHSGYYAFLFFGFSSGHQVETTALNYTWAVFMVLFGVIINRVRLTWARSVSVLLGALGAMAVVVPDWAQATISWGMLAGLGAGFCFGLFTPLAVRWGYEPRFVTWWMLMVSFLGFSCALALTGTPVTFSSTGLVGALYIGVGIDGIGYVLWQRANRVLPPWALAVWACLIPVLNLTFLSATFGLVVSPSVFVGAALIVSGIAVQQVSGAVTARTTQ